MRSGDAIGNPLPISVWFFHPNKKGATPVSTRPKAHSLPAQLSADERNNELYYGDNLSILRDHILSNSIDLIYLDPPFNSNADYNVLFTERDGTRAAAQIKAFEDTWEWDEAAALAYQEVVESGGRVSQTMRAFWTLLGSNDMMAYLAMLAPRLVELHRVLKPTGSIYLHCDPTASHYIKMLMDTIFGKEHFRNEIVWCYKTRHFSKKHFGRKHDTIFFYTKSDEYTFNWKDVLRPLSEVTIKKFKYEDEKGKYRLVGRGIKGSPIQSAKDVDPYWEVTHPELVTRDYLKPGVPVEDYWLIDIINQSARERLGYPTQKPEALLERIIKASSNEGDVVLDPFCGCGTTVSVAEHLNRQWVGIDITHLAIGLIKHRLFHAYDGRATYRVTGEPVTLYDAEALAKADPYEFQWWAAGLVGGRIDKKRGADQGIDGRLFFHDDPRPGTTKQIVLSVKSGRIPPAHIREIRGVIDREEADIGVLLTLQEPTKPMRAEAASAGFYNSTWGTKHPRIQIITIEELLEGKGIDYPQSLANVTHKRAVKKRKVEKAQPQRLPFTH